MIVVDASVALKWVLPENGSDAAWALRTESLIAPSLWLLEAANALWRYVQRERLTVGDATLLLQRLATAPVTSILIHDDVPSALTIALTLRHPAYDCLYLALALKHDTYVVTADQRFANACSRDKALKHRVRLLDGI